MYGDFDVGILFRLLKWTFFTYSNNLRLLLKKGFWLVEWLNGWLALIWPAWCGSNKKGQ